MSVARGGRTNQGGAGPPPAPPLKPPLIITNLIAKVQYVTKVSPFKYFYTKTYLVV